MGFYEQRHVNKVSVCEWASEATGSRCNQLVYATDSLGPHAPKHCIDHAALLKQQSATATQAAAHPNSTHTLVIDSTFESVPPPGRNHKNVNPARLVGGLASDTYDLSELRLLRQSRAATKRKLADNDLNNDDEDGEEVIAKTQAEFTNTQQFYNRIDLDHDLDLLDPADSLDRTMLKLIASNRAVTLPAAAEALTASGDLEHDYDMALG